MTGLRIERARVRTILHIGLPIIGGMVSQNVLNLVDTAMVGTLGDAALAGVGVGSFTNFMGQALVMGLATGVQAMASRRLGEGRTGETAHALNGGILLALSMAIPLGALLILLAPGFFPYLNDDVAVIAVGVPYLQARLVGMPGLGINFAFRGYWNGVNLTTLYMRTILVMHACNVVLNYLLIFGALGFPELGATGAGVGTTISTYIGTAYYFVLGRRHAGEGGFLRGLPDRTTLRTMLRLSVPSGVQMLFFASGLTALFWIIGRVGTADLAAANVLINIMLVAILPALGLGLAAGSLVGQALGRHDPEDAARWGWDVVKIGMVALVLLGLPMVLVPELVLSGFLHDPATLALATLPLQVFGAAIWLDGMGMVLQNALLGAGASTSVMVVSIGLQWGLFLPAAYVIGPVLGYGLLGIWSVQVLYRALQAGVYATLWRRRGWTSIEV